MTLPLIPCSAPISVPLVSVKSTLDYLLNVQTGVALAIATLGQIGVFDATTVLEGVADIFAALGAMSGACIAVNEADPSTIAH